MFASKVKKLPGKVLLIFFLLFLLLDGHVISQNNHSKENLTDKIYTQWMYSQIVKDSFQLQVYVPENYDQKESKKYPVIYMTDGDRYFGLVSDFVYSILHRDDIEVIVVGIGYGAKSINNEKRRRDYKTQFLQGQETGSTPFRKFIKEELFPLIESKYPIDKSNRTLLGWSLGGAFTLNTMFKDPLMFKNYLVLSGRLNYEDDSIIEIEKEYAKKNEDLNARLFFSMGDKDERYDQFPAFIDRLQSRNYKELKLEHAELKGKSHDILALGEGLGLGLQSIFVPKDINEPLLQLLNTKGVKAAIEKYHQMKKEEYSEYDFREKSLNILGYYLMEQNRFEESIEILKLNASEYPKSFNVYDSLGESYYLSKNKEMALLNYKKSLEINPQNSNAEQMIQKIKSQK